MFARRTSYSTYHLAWGFRGITRISYLGFDLYSSECGVVDDLGKNELGYHKLKQPRPGLGKKRSKNKNEEPPIGDRCV